MRSGGVAACAVCLDLRSIIFDHVMPVARGGVGTICKSCASFATNEKREKRTWTLSGFNGESI